MLLEELKDSLERNPIIAAIQNNMLNKALESPAEIIFDLKISLLEIEETIKKVHLKNKKIFIHIDLADGLGKDKTEKIGEYIQITEADKDSNVKSYSIEALFKIDNNFARNYDVEKANITKGSLNISPKNVVLVINDLLLYLTFLLLYMLKVL